MNHEQAAFKGAASLPTPEQIAAQPWRYPQGRIPPEEDTLECIALQWWEALIIWAAIIGLAGAFWGGIYYIYRTLFP
jgi:hypothetical protein